MNTLRPPSRPARTRRAFALIAAIIVMAVLAALVAVMTSHLGTSVKRSRLETESAQLQEILLAAEPFARQLASEPGQQQLRVPLPPELGATCTCTRGADGAVRVEAQRSGRTATQRLTYKQQNGAWQLTSAHSPAY